MERSRKLDNAPTSAVIVSASSKPLQGLLPSKLSKQSDCDAARQLTHAVLKSSLENALMLPVAARDARVEMSLHPHGMVEFEADTIPHPKINSVFDSIVEDPRARAFNKGYLELRFALWVRKKII